MGYEGTENENISLQLAGEFLKDINTKRIPLPCEGCFYIIPPIDRGYRTNDSIYFPDYYDEFEASLVRDQISSKRNLGIKIIFISLDNDLNIQKLETWASGIGEKYTTKPTGVKITQANPSDLAEYNLDIKQSHSCTVGSVIFLF